MSADLAAEQAILGHVIQSAGRTFDSLGLTAEHFHAPPHAELWTAIASHLAAGKPLDASLLLWSMNGRAKTMGPLIIECVERAAVHGAALWHAEHLRAHTARRSIAEAAAKLARLADPDSGERDVVELREMARAIVDEHTRDVVDAGGVTMFLDAVLAGMDRWDTPDRDVLPTRWTYLDDMLTGGLRPGHLMIVGARPGVGKSLLATELARNVAPHGVGVLFSSLEMSQAEVTNRIASALTRVPLGTLTGGHASDEQMELLRTLVGRVADWPLHIDDRASVGVAAIRGRARDLTRAPAGLGLIIVDYLQLLTPADPKANREQQVASFSRALKLLAKDLQVPVVALAQVNRGPMSRADKRPQMSDLRESGAIEADADEVLLLHHDEETPDELEVNVVKNRHGETGLLYLNWQPATGRITNPTTSGGASW